MLTLLVAAAAAFHLHENGRDVDFTYDWPAQASAIPSLKTKLRSDLQRDRLRTAKNAGEDGKWFGAGEWAALGLPAPVRRFLEGA